MTIREGQWAIEYGGAGEIGERDAISCSWPAAHHYFLCTISSSVRGNLSPPCKTHCFSAARKHFSSLFYRLKWGILVFFIYNSNTFPRSLFFAPSWKWGEPRNFWEKILFSSGIFLIFFLWLPTYKIKIGIRCGTTLHSVNSRVNIRFFDNLPRSNAQTEAWYKRSR